MKASELIVQLQACIDKSGDGDIELNIGWHLDGLARECSVQPDPYSGSKIIITGEEELCEHQN
jgi:hypothetical protein